MASLSVWIAVNSDRLLWATLNLSLKFVCYIWTSEFSLTGGEKPMRVCCPWNNIFLLITKLWNFKVGEIQVMTFPRKRISYVLYSGLFLLVPMIDLVQLVFPQQWLQFLLRKLFLIMACYWGLFCTTLTFIHAKPWRRLFLYYLR